MAKTLSALADFINRGAMDVGKGPRPGLRFAGRSGVLLQATEMFSIVEGIQMRELEKFMKGTQLDGPTEEVVDELAGVRVDAWGMTTDDIFLDAARSGLFEMESMLTWHNLYGTPDDEEEMPRRFHQSSETLKTYLSIIKPSPARDRFTREVEAVQLAAMSAKLMPPPRPDYLEALPVLYPAPSYYKTCMAVPIHLLALHCDHSTRGIEQASLKNILDHFAAASIVLGEIYVYALQYLVLVTSPASPARLRQESNLVHVCRDAILPPSSHWATWSKLRSNHSRCYPRRAKISMRSVESRTLYLS